MSNAIGGGLNPQESLRSSWGLNDRDRPTKSANSLDTKTLRPYLWILASTFTFSWMMVLTPLAGEGVGWQVVALVRSVIPLVLMSAWCLASGVRIVVLGPRILWMRSLAGSCSLIGTFYSLNPSQGLSPAEVITIANLFPIWVALLSWPMLGKAPGMSVWLSALCAVCGVALIQGASISEGNLTALVVVGVSICTALAMMGLNQLKGIDPRAVVVHFSGTSLVFSLAAFFLLKTSVPADDFSMRHLLLLLGVGVSATAGQLFLTKAFTSGDAAKLSVTYLVQIFFVLTLQIIFLGKSLELRQALGIPLVLGPAAWLMLHRPKRPPQVDEAAEPALEQVAPE